MNNQASPYFTHNQTLNKKYQVLQDEILQADKKFIYQQSKADQARQDYERSLAKVNQTIDQFDSHYKPVLNRIQEADEYQINFVKMQLDKLASSSENLGRGLRDRGEEMRQVIGAVNS